MVLMIFSFSYPITNVLFYKDYMILIQYFLFNVLILSLIILFLILRLASFFMFFIYLPYAENLICIIFLIFQVAFNWHAQPVS